MVLLHQCKELEKNVMSMLPIECYTLCRILVTSEQTFAVVLLHAGKAFAAASMASLVSSMPISGTVPSSSRVAGSRRP